MLSFDLLFYMAGSSRPQHFFAAGCIYADFEGLCSGLPHYYHKYFFLILKIQVLPHQDLKDQNSYVKGSPHLNPIVNDRNLTIYELPLRGFQYT